MSYSQQHRARTVDSIALQTAGEAAHATLATENRTDLVDVTTDVTETPLLDAAETTKKPEAPDPSVDMGAKVAEGMKKLNSGDDGYNVSYKPVVLQRQAERAAIAAEARAERAALQRDESLSDSEVNTKIKEKGYSERIQELNNKIAHAQDVANGHVNDTGDSKGNPFFVDANPGQSKKQGVADQTTERFRWQLRTGASASAALDCWLKNDEATIADCASAAVALQLDALRQRIGNTTFDKFCAENGRTSGRYFISPNAKQTILHYFTEQIDFYKDGVEKGSLDQRENLSVGDMVYVQNFPDYSDASLKKLGYRGNYSGENCTYMGQNAAGESLFEGFGITSMTESAMNEELAAAYMLHCVPGVTEQNIERSAVEARALELAARPDCGLLTEMSAWEESGTRGRRLSEAQVLTALQTGSLPTAR